MPDFVRAIFIHCSNKNRNFLLYKKAIIAIARMLLTALYHMLKNGENYNAELYRKSDLPPVVREITVEQAILIARNQGYKIKSATA